MHSSLARPALALAAVVLAGCGAHTTRPHGLPLSFTVNRGQFAPEVRYAARAPGFELAATDAGLVLAAGSQRVRMGFAGARRRAPVAGAALPGVANYLLGADRRRWRTGVPTYRDIAYRGVWPGVDVVVYGAGGRLEYDVHVAPGADPGAVRLDFSAPVRLEDGRLRVGALRMPAPRASQGGREVDSGYVLRADGTVGFRLGRYDRRAPLVIDPVLAYSTYLGAGNLDEAKAIAVDGAGSAYVTGQTQSTSFPGAPGTPDVRGDAFVVKLAPGGGSLAWSTFFGGTDFDEGHGIALAPGGGVVVAGGTASTDFPTPGVPLQGSNHGHQDAFLAELSSSGVMTYATYLGGGDDDSATGVAVDPAGHTYLAGTTSSTDLPVSHPYQSDNHGGSDAFAARLTGHAPDYLTYLGGTGNDLGTGIAADAGGAAYLAGSAGLEFPLVDPVQNHNAGMRDAFLTKLDPAGSPVFSTYLGGDSVDEAKAVAVTAAGAPVVVGDTQSQDFPTSPHADRQGPLDAFVTRLRADGKALASSAYLGGSDGESANAVAVDREGRIVVAGQTRSADFPTANPAQATKGADLDAFVTQYDAAAATRLMSTFLGGHGGDQAAGVAVDGFGNAYVTGWTEADFPTASPFQGMSGGGIDGFVSALAIGSAPLPAPVPIVPTPPPAPVGPETAIVARPPTVGSDRVVQFRFTSASAGATFACQVDGAAFTPCTSPFTSRTLRAGAHTFAVRAVDASGNPDTTPATFAFRVTPPPEHRSRTCAPKPGRPCALKAIVCPKAALCLLDRSVDGSARLHCSGDHACGFGLVHQSRARYRCTGSGRCQVAVTIYRQWSDLGQAVAPSALLVYAPKPGSLTVTGPKLKTVHVTVRRASAVRVPLRLTPAAGKGVRQTVTTTFRPAAGPAITRLAGVRLRRPGGATQIR